MPVPIGGCKKRIGKMNNGEAMDTATNVSKRIPVMPIRKLVSPESKLCHLILCPF